MLKMQQVVAVKTQIKVFQYYCGITYIWINTNTFFYNDVIVNTLSEEMDHKLDTQPVFRSFEHTHTKL